MVTLLYFFYFTHFKNQCRVMGPVRKALLLFLLGFFITLLGILFFCTKAFVGLSITCLVLV